MLSVGDVVVYGGQGVCKIDCIQTKQIGKQTADYYVLKPIYNDNTTFFVPLKNELLVGKMKDVLTVLQANELIKKANEIDELKFANENHRREQYKDILANSNREKLVSLIKTIRTERDIRRNIGKKLNIYDEQALRKAEQLLFGELAFVLGKTQDEINDIMML